MEVQTTILPNLFILKNIISQDNRGMFRKVFASDLFQKNDLNTDFKEFYYSVSYKNTIRGMHFQIPPHEHHKLVFVNQGSIVDVVLDIRKNSPTYGKHFSCVLNADNGIALYIPKGMAHGFLAQEDNTIVNYMQTSLYSKECDKGIHYNSFGFNWKTTEPIVSERDLTFETFQNFKTPFL
ncbi:MAG TPA: dTDP-4-dehydrorhamnose 3,5-epimerase family protein [Bacteroidales bacterium]|nr:dTDP-4-dehydrorhamnose 3,5-epimerase family protein [Bacteroidales bacterium]